MPKINKNIPNLPSNWSYMSEDEKNQWLEVNVPDNNEVNEENGPFTCIERTASKWGLLGYHVRQRMNEWGFKIPAGDSNQIKVREMAQLQKQHQTFLATVNPGDLFFHTRSVHYASFLTKGFRRVLWFYF